MTPQLSPVAVADRRRAGVYKRAGWVREAAILLFFFFFGGFWRVRFGESDLRSAGSARRALEGEEVESACVFPCSRRVVVARKGRLSAPSFCSLLSRPFRFFSRVVGGSLDGSVFRQQLGRQEDFWIVALRQQADMVAGVEVLFSSSSSSSPPSRLPGGRKRSFTRLLALSFWFPPLVPGFIFPLLSTSTPIATSLASSVSSMTTWCSPKPASERTHTETWRFSATSSTESCRIKTRWATRRA